MAWFRRDCEGTVFRYCSQGGVGSGGESWSRCGGVRKGSWGKWVKEEARGIGVGELDGWKCGVGGAELGYCGVAVLMYVG